LVFSVAAAAGAIAGGTLVDGSAVFGDDGTAAEGVESWAKTGETKINTARKITTNRGETIRIKAF
jgi:hypothetical protein